MKNNMNRRLVKGFFFMGLLSCTMGSYAQRGSVKADPQLGTIRLLDDNGSAINADNLESGKVIKMQIPVIKDNGNTVLPSGTCKIKIGLGSKLELDPAFNLNSAGLGSYFTWTSADNGGQVEITGTLSADLPADLTYVTVSFGVKATVLGRSTITANYLVTNHNPATLLSDENGANNMASLSYKVEPATPAAAGEATQPFLYPNPVVDVKAVMIETKQGEFKGTYAITISDAAGKNIHNGSVKLDGVKRFTYQIGNMAAGKYLMQLRKTGAEKVYILKFEKL